MEPEESRTIWVNSSNESTVSWQQSQQTNHMCIYMVYILWYFGSYCTDIFFMFLYRFQSYSFSTDLRLCTKW